MKVKPGSVIWTNLRTDGIRLCTIGVVVKVDDTDKTIHARVVGWKVNTNIIDVESKSVDKEVFQGYVIMEEESFRNGDVLVFLDFWPVMNRLRTIKEQTKLDSELYKEVA